MESRKSPRAEWHDYSGGLYFVTIVTNHRLPYLGTIVDGKMQLSPVGKILQFHLDSLAQHFSFIRTDCYVIMPNHFHMVIFIDKDKAPVKHRSPQLVDSLSKQQNRQSYFSNVAHLQGVLSVIVGGIKSSATRDAHKLGLNIEWQSRFHDRIVRSYDEWMTIRHYVQNNVEKWEEDRFNPEA